MLRSRKELWIHQEEAENPGKREGPSFGLMRFRIAPPKIGVKMVSAIHGANMAAARTLAEAHANIVLPSLINEVPAITTMNGNAKMGSVSQVGGYPEATNQARLIASNPVEPARVRKSSACEMSTSARNTQGMDINPGCTTPDPDAIHTTADPTKETATANEAIDVFKTRRAVKYVPTAPSRLFRARSSPKVLKS